MRDTTSWFISAVSMATISLAGYCFAQSDLFPVASSTIALWRFNEASDSTISDVSGHGYNAVISGSAPLVES
jgi:hypothetical protein